MIQSIRASPNNIDPIFESGLLKKNNCACLKALSIKGIRRLKIICLYFLSLMQS